MADFHTHTNEEGFLVKCYHRSRTILLSGSFWLGVTVSFPLEHFIWVKVWPFNLLTKWMGL